MGDKIRAERSHTQECKVPQPKKQVSTSDSGKASAPPLPAVFQTTKLITSLPKTQQVYELLRHAIVTLALSPGDPINEKLICEQLGISRTPLREALLQLSSENLITVVPHSGTFVSRIDLQNVFDGHLVREALEIKASRLAALKMNTEIERQLEFNLHQQKYLAQDQNYSGFYKIDEEFHQIICELGSSKRVWRIVYGAKAQLDQVMQLAPVDSRMDRWLQEHLEIIEALKSRNPDRCEQSMKVHLSRVFNAIRQVISDNSDYFSSSSPEELDRYESAFHEDKI